MGLFTREQFAAPDDEAGVLMEGLSAALLTWAAMQGRQVTVADAAMTFNTTPEVIREAVDGGMWLYIVGTETDPTKQRLELDGA